jgi:hypothetical protein
MPSTQPVEIDPPAAVAPEVIYVAACDDARDGIGCMVIDPADLFVLDCPNEDGTIDAYEYHRVRRVRITQFTEIKVVE